MRPELQQYIEMKPAEKQALAEAELDLPIQPITEEDLPPVMPVNMYEMLNPIAAQDFENKKTEVQKLLEKRQEAENNQEAVAISRVAWTASPLRPHFGPCCAWPP